MLFMQHFAKGQCRPPIKEYTGVYCWRVLVLVFNKYPHNYAFSCQARSWWNLCSAFLPHTTVRVGQALLAVEFVEPFEGEGAEVAGQFKHGVPQRAEIPSVAGHGGPVAGIEHRRRAHAKELREKRLGTEHGYEFLPWAEDSHPVRNPTRLVSRFPFHPAAASSLSHQRWNGSAPPRTGSCRTRPRRTWTGRSSARWCTQRNYGQ